MTTTKIEKELHPKVQEQVTIKTARDMLYDIGRMLCPYDDTQPDVPGALAALQETVSILQSMPSAGGAATPTEASMKSVSFATPEVFMAWVTEQFTTASAEGADKPDAMNKRLENLGKAMVLAKAHWEDTGEKPALSISMEEAYVGCGGQPMDLTVRSEQKTTEVAVTEANKAAISKLGEVMRAQPQTAAAKVEKSGGQFRWPQDMTAIAKRDGDTDGWGKDPKRS